jgi:hypothetical protein
MMLSAILSTLCALNLDRLLLLRDRDAVLRKTGMAVSYELAEVLERTECTYLSEVMSEVRSLLISLNSQVSTFHTMEYKPNPEANETC